MTDYGKASSFTITDSNGVLWNTATPSNIHWEGRARNYRWRGGNRLRTGSYRKHRQRQHGRAFRKIHWIIGLISVDAGTIKLTTGVADLFDRALFNITDPYSGYVTFKETSLQNSINNYTTEINQMNDQIAQKKQQMLNEFVAMETAINTIQNESSWLTSQLTAASNGWQLTAATSSASL